MTSIHVSPDLIDNHAASLRRLARRLVRDPHDADDVLQETWLRAMQSPPRSAHRIGSWLETILSNVVRRRARQGRRAIRREHEVARDEHVASTLDLVTRRQTLHALTAAIVHLEDHLQEIVFARYFEDLPPREIARQTGRPVEQVYRDLDRARRALRRELGNRLGEGSRWQRSVSALFGISMSAWMRSLVRGLIAGGLFVTIKKLMVATLTAACAVALVLMARGEAPGESGMPEHASDPAASTMSSAALLADPETPTREQVAAADPSAPAALTHRYDMEIWMRDEDDLAASGGRIWIGPERHPLNATTAGDDGVVRLAWLGRHPRMTIVWVSPDARDGGKRLHRRVVHAGLKEVVPLRVKRQARSSRGTFVLYAENIAAGWSPKSPPPLAIDEDGLAWFTSGRARTPVIDGSAEEFEVLAVGNLTIESSWRVAATLTEVEETPPEKQPAARGALEGRVLDQEGAPAGEVMVILAAHADRRSPWTTQTDADGTFRIEDIPPGHYHVRAGGGDDGLARGEIDVLGGATNSWFGDLDRGFEIRGSLLAEDGTGLAGWHVEVVAPGEGQSWIDGATTGDDGRFAIPNVPMGPYTLRARAPDTPVATWRRDAVWPGPEQRWTVADHARAVGVVRAAPARHGELLPSAEIRLWSDDGGEGIRAIGGDDGATAKDVPAGLHRIIAAHAGVTHQEVAQVHVTAEEVADPGPIELPEPALLLLPDGEGPAGKMGVMRVHDAIHSRVGELGEGRRKLAVAPGDYILVRGDERREMRVEPGVNLIEWPTR